MRRILITCVLALGCGRVEYIPCADSGAPLETDAGAVDAGSIAQLSDVEACRLLEYATRHLDGCEADCPWPGIAGPGITPQVCDLDAVITCVETVSSVNECAFLASTVTESCAVAACQ